MCYALMMHIHLFKDLKNYIWIFGTSHYRHSGDTETKQTEDWNRRVSYLKMCLLLRGGRESWLLSHSQQQYRGRFNGMINGSKYFQDKSVYIFSLIPQPWHWKCCHRCLRYILSRKFWGLERRKSLFIQHGWPCFTEIFLLLIPVHFSFCKDLSVLNFVNL